MADAAAAATTVQQQQHRSSTINQAQLPAKRVDV